MKPLQTGTSFAFDSVAYMSPPLPSDRFLEVFRNLYSLILYPQGWEDDQQAQTLSVHSSQVHCSIWPHNLSKHRVTAKMLVAVSKVNVSDGDYYSFDSHTGVCKMQYLVKTEINVFSSHHQPPPLTEWSPDGTPFIRGCLCSTSTSRPPGKKHSSSILQCLHYLLTAPSPHL